jgi:hypothetical protein
MPAQNTSPLTHYNRYSADDACRHCDGVIRHECWCLTHNASVRYAYHAIADPERLSRGDHLLLHALGARWDAESILPTAVAATEQTNDILGNLTIALLGLFAITLSLYRLYQCCCAYRS